MPVVQHNPPELFPTYRCYTHAKEIRGDSRLPIISGLNGYLQDGRTMPESFEEQADEANVRMRVKYLGTHACSLTVICSQLLDPRWKLEVEAMAAT